MLELIVTMVIGTRSQQEWAYEHPVIEGRRAHRSSPFTENLYVVIVDLGRRKIFLSGISTGNVPILSLTKLHPCFSKQPYGNSLDHKIDSKTQ